MDEAGKLYQDYEFETDEEIQRKREVIRSVIVMGVAAGWDVSQNEARMEALNRRVRERQRRKMWRERLAEIRGWLGVFTGVGALPVFLGNHPGGVVGVVGSRRRQLGRLQPKLVARPSRASGGHPVRPHIGYDAASDRLLRRRLPAARSPDSPVRRSSVSGALMSP